MEYIGPATCISAVIASSYEEDLGRESFQFMLDYAEAEGLAITGDIRGKILFTERMSRGNQTYLEIDIPFENNFT
jgi:effector-binding domain-containing protein